MPLLYKQLMKEILKNKVFVLLTLLLTVFTSFMYFFVHYSIDGNLQILNTFSALTENQILYQAALNSNNILARNFLFSLIGLTAFGFTMFYYRFFRANKKQIGCLKSLGFNDNIICSFCLLFTEIISIIGAFIGLGAGYFASDVLINANMESYAVTDTIKSLHLFSIIIGLFLPGILFCLVTFFSYGWIKGKECGILLTGESKSLKDERLLRLVEKFVRLLPAKNKFPIRIALRKPVSAFLIVFSVMTFSVMFILGYSLNASSQKVLDTQTLGHHYLFDTHFETIQQTDAFEKESTHYLEISTAVQKDPNGQAIMQQIIGLEEKNTLLELMSPEKKTLPSPKKGTVYINLSLQESYGFQVGDQITVTLDGKQFPMTVGAIAFNAKTNNIYLAQTELTQLLELPSGSFNGMFSMEKPAHGEVITHEQKMDTLERNAVSNRTSAVINQTIGCIVGCILIFLALLVNFSDSTKDILILNLMGYRAKDIKKMLINIYQPLLCFSFVITFLPCIQIARTVQATLSIQTGDYMPFQIRAIVILFIFILLNLIYILIEMAFGFGIKRTIKSEGISYYTNES